MPEKPDADRGSFQLVVDGLGEAAVRFAETVVETLNRSGRADDAEVAAGLRDGLKAQAAGLTRGVAVLMRSASKEERDTVNARAVDSGGVALVEAAQRFTTGSQTARIGIVDMLEPIKKIIRMILDVFGIELPGWLNKLLDFLNNLIGGLGGLLGLKEGQRATQARTMMYSHLRDIYRTDAAQQLAQRTGDGRVDDEDG